MMFTLAIGTGKLAHLRNLDYLVQLIKGVTFKDNIEVEQDNHAAACMGLTNTTFDKNY